MNRDVFLSLLALDSYNRGYGRNLFANGSASSENEAGRGIGTATILNVDLPTGSEAAGFYAIAYEWNGETIISYRGTDFEFDLTDPFDNPLVRDIWNGWSVGAGYSDTAQGGLAIDFYQSVLEGTVGLNLDVFSINSAPITLTGHSLGGGLAGAANDNSAQRVAA